MTTLDPARRAQMARDAAALRTMARKLADATPGPTPPECTTLLDAAAHIDLLLSLLYVKDATDGGPAR